MASQVASAPGRAAGVADQAHSVVTLAGGRTRLAWPVADTRVPGGAAGSGGYPAQAPGPAMRRAVSAGISEAAERQAAEIRREASAQLTAIREAAEREAAELRAAVTEMLGGVSVTEDLISPAGPAIKPAGQLTARPATRPAAKPRGRPGTGSQGRQVRVMRKVVIASAALLLVGVGSGAAEVALHGFSFFLFRDAGAGAGNSKNLNENQGPGQPGAPGVHHQASPG